MMLASLLLLLHLEFIGVVYIHFFLFAIREGSCPARFDTCGNLAARAVIAFEGYAEPLVPEDHAVGAGLDADPAASATFMIYTDFTGFFIYLNAVFRTGLYAGSVLAVTARERHGKFAPESSLSVDLLEADPVHRHLRFAHGIDKAFRLRVLDGAGDLTCPAGEALLNDAVDLLHT
jgi:hypothetical protein